MRQRLGALAVVSVLTMSRTAIGQGGPANMIDLTKPELLAAEFTLACTGEGAAGEWAIVSDPTARGGLAIAQVSKDRTDYRFPLAIYKPYSGTNLEVSARFKPVAGNIDQAGGIVVRLRTPDDYYVVRANALEDNVRFYRVVRGRRQQINGADTKVASGVWHILALRAERRRFTVSFDGAQLFTADDPTFDQPGQVALWTKADSVTHFDSIAIRPLP